MSVIGIDPGANGGIAWISHDPALGSGGIILKKLPQDRAELRRLLMEEFAGRADVVVVERQEPRPTYWKAKDPHLCPKCGYASEQREQRSILKSTVLLFGGYCAILGTLEALQLPIVDIRPVQWRAALGIPKGTDKKGLVARARQLFPTVKITNDTADALLLAEYGRRLYPRTP